MTTFSIPEMSCGHCKAKIEDAVMDADEGAVIAFDMDAREVEIDSTLPLWPTQSRRRATRRASRPERLLPHPALR